MIQTLTIPDWRPVSVNLVTGRHWSVLHNAKKAASKMIWAYALAQGITKAAGKRRVTLAITYKGRQQEADPSNLRKVLEDALVTSGLLVDDDAQRLEWGETTQTRGTKTETVITLEDL